MFALHKCIQKLFPLYLSTIENTFEWLERHQSDIYTQTHTKTHLQRFSRDHQTDELTERMGNNNFININFMHIKRFFSKFTSFRFAGFFFFFFFLISGACAGTFFRILFFRYAHPSLLQNLIEKCVEMFENRRKFKFSIFLHLQQQNIFIRRRMGCWNWRIQWLVSRWTFLCMSAYCIKQSMEMKTQNAMHHHSIYAERNRNEKHIYPANQFTITH